MYIKFKQKGDFRNTERFLRKAHHIKYKSILDKYGQLGVEALMVATPRDSGLTSVSWGYVIEQENDKSTIIWTNSHMADSISVALLIQYGHATGNGGYVRGLDYINPTMRSIFEDMANEAWKEVSRL